MDPQEQSDPIDLEPQHEARVIDSAADRRPRMEQPLPVRLMAVNDIHLPTPGGIEQELETFYVGILGFEPDGEGPELIFRAENFQLRFEIVEGRVHREDYRPTGVEVESLIELEHRLIHAEIEYTRLRGLIAGQEALALRDPAGNWLEVTQIRVIR